MRKPVIYLVGYICSGNIMAKCKEWREWFKTARPDYTWIDPLEGEPTAGMKDLGLTSTMPSAAIVLRDMASVRDADIILANTDTFEGKRPLIGSIYEMAWAGMLLKPQLILSDDPYYSKHPFVQHFAAVITKDRDEILRVLDYIAKGL